MSLTPGLRSAVDLFYKLQRDTELLNEEVTSDRFFNFVVTGYSLIDWVKHDPALPPPARMGDEIDTLYKEPWLRVCGDLPTASKHFLLTKRTPITANATSAAGYGVGRFGKGAFGTGEESIELRINDGSTWTALEFATGRHSGVAAILQAARRIDLIEHARCPRATKSVSTSIADELPTDSGALETLHVP